MKFLTILLFLVACISLYYGSGMLLLDPRFRGESYFVRERIVYGVLPTLSSVALLVATSWMWVRSGGSVTFGKAVCISFALAATAIILFWVGLTILANVRQSQPW